MRFFSSFFIQTFITTEIVKYLLDYVVTGIDLVSGDDVLTKQDGVDANTCANFCNKETDCKSINFCNEPATTTCELTMNSPLEPSAKTVRNERCLNYVSKSGLSSTWGGRQEKSPVAEKSNRMSGGAFFGVICAMIILGLVLGAIGLVGYNRYQQRGIGLPGLGVSVKYVRQNNDNGLINNEEQPATSFSTAVPLD